MNWKFDFSPDTSAVSHVSKSSYYDGMLRFKQSSGRLTHDGRCALGKMLMDWVFAELRWCVKVSALAY